MILVPFADIHLLRLDQPIAYESPYGNLVGTVHHVTPGQHVGISNGHGVWRITPAHEHSGVLTTTEAPR